MYHSKLIQRNLFKQTSKITKNRDVGSSLPEPKLIDRVINGGFKMGLYQHVRELWKKPQANILHEEGQVGTIETKLFSVKKNAGFEMKGKG